MEAKDGSTGVDFEGTYTTVVEHELIEFVTHDDRLVSISFTPVEDGIRLIETVEAETENSAEQQRLGWPSILNKFARHVESKVKCSAFCLENHEWMQMADCGSFPDKLPVGRCCSEEYGRNQAVATYLWTQTIAARYASCPRNRERIWRDGNV